MAISWSFGGTTLSTDGVLRELNEYMDIPERRGENLVVPFRHGRIHTNKYFEERKITLGFSILASSATAQDTTFDTLRALFAPGRQQVLSQTREDTSIRTANAVVESPMQVERIVPFRMVPDGRFDELWVAACSPPGLVELERELAASRRRERLVVVTPSAPLPVGRWTMEWARISAAIRLGAADMRAAIEAAARGTGPVAVGARADGLRARLEA